MARAETRKLAPALTASALLHLGLFGAGLVAWPWIHKIVPVQVTPVTLLTSDQLAALTAATRAEKPEQATTPDPEPVTQPSPPPAPAPAPVPTPPPAPAPQPKAAPAPKPAPPTPPAPAPKPVVKPVEKTPPAKPTAAAPPKTPPAKSIDLDALASSLAQNTKAAGPTARPSAPKGPARPETDLADRPSDGQARATTMTALGPIRDKLIRLWNPNCGADTAANVSFRVQIYLNPDGSLSKNPDFPDYPGVNFNRPEAAAKFGPVLTAAVARAQTAVVRAAPYDGLPKDDYNFWKTIVLNFDAKTACGVR
jgi:outer membrane biosynthesis protein TonB